MTGHPDPWSSGPMTPTTTHDDEQTHAPMVWAICDTCNGDGTRALGGLAMTASEWAEWGDDERSDYFAGAYDQRCDECDGSGKVRTPDCGRMTPEQVEAWEREQAEAWDDRAMQAAERRMGC